MTETDYLKERLAALKIILTAISGGIITLGVYAISDAPNFQINGVKIFLYIVAIALLGKFGFYLGREYNRLLNELRRL